ncbi:hypothetical protein HK405_004943 [Cladochytrium tenue]|nr:hypothetical protein HK405_004943 [Cladochytrium tenue]
MDAFEAALNAATAVGDDSSVHPNILAAIGLVVSADGTVLYRHAAGRQSLAPDAPPVDPDSTIVLGSAGKFITTIAALQLVDRGLIAIDDPVDTVLPELARIPVIEPAAAAPRDTPDAEAGQDEPTAFILRPPRSPITLRHLLTHSAGIPSQDDPHPLLEAWRNSPEAAAAQPPDDAPPIVRMFSEPLLFDPGQGWRYGACIHWLTLFVTRLSGAARFADAVQASIFDPLDLRSWTYNAAARPDLADRLLQMVRRPGPEDGDKPAAAILPDDDPPLGLVCSVSDLATVLADIISPAPRLFSPTSARAFAGSAFAPRSSALLDLRRCTEDYAAPAGIPDPVSLEDPDQLPVNFAPGGLVVDFSSSPSSLRSSSVSSDLDTSTGESAAAATRLPRSGFPHGTVTWNGMPNVVWAVHPSAASGHRPGIVAIFATQLLPVDDPAAVDLAMTFMRSAWATYGPRPGIDYEITRS